MRLSQSAGRRFGKFSTRARSVAAASAIDLLESRRLLSGETLGTVISPVLASTSSPSSNSITLNQHFTDPTIPGTLATFNTSLGQITVALTDAATPLTVANFLSYVSSGAYADTIFHRSATLSANSSGGSPTTPADIIQGGGYLVNGLNINHIPTKAPVDDEYTTEVEGDVAGTLAMAKTSSANSATSEWYFNVHDNTSALDTPTTDSNGVTTSYTVFGTVLSGMNVVDEIAALPTYNVSSSLNTVPVVGLTEGQAKLGRPITAANLVYTDSITTETGTDYTVTSDNNALVTPKVTDGVLSFTYASGLFGTANITIVAKNLDGTSASTTFAVTVPNSATPTAGPTTAAVTAPNIVSGKTGTFSVLAGNTDSVAALNSSSVAITTQPTHGTATVNSSTGLITYTPAAGYTGSDTLTYTVADTAGTVSSSATVTLNVVAPPATVTIGTRTANSLTFTEPSGVIGHLTIKGGTGLITFASSAVTTSTSGGVVIATGAGATISSIVITNTGAVASLALTSNGTVSLGSVTDTNSVSIVNAPNATLGGDSSFKTISRLILAAATDATISLGSGSTTLVIPKVTDSTVGSTGAISSITSTQWLNDNGGYYTLTTPSIGRLLVTGTFANVLNLTSAGRSLGTSTVGQASAAWTVAGSVGAAVFATPASTWSLTATGGIGSISINGNLTSNVIATTIGTLNVTGTTTDVSIETSSNVSSSQVEIGRLKFGGAVNGSLISTSGHLGSITAASLGSSNVSAGAIGSVFVSGVANTADFTTNGLHVAGQLQIGRFHVGGNFNSSAIAATGGIGPVTIASTTSSTLTAATISSVIVPGASTGTTFTTNGNTSGGALQFGLLRVGGAFSTGAVNASQSVGSISAASMTGTQITAGSLASLLVAGITNGGTIETNGAFVKGRLQMGRLIFRGAVQGTMINSGGNIGSVDAVSLTGTQIYAAVNSAQTESPTLPTGTSEFTFDARIGSVTLAKTGTAFSNSLISADMIGPLHLGSISTSNNSVTEGVAAHKITSFSGTLVPGGVLNAGPAQLKSAATLKAYETKAKVTLGDFVISLL